jgi:hypothetical protein
MLALTLTLRELGAVAPVNDGAPGSTPGRAMNVAWIVHRQGDKCDNRMIECLFSLKQSVKNRSRHSPCC